MAKDTRVSVESSFTDVANATRFADLHGERFRWVSSWETFITWDGSRWRRDPGGVVVRGLAKDVARTMYSMLADANFIGDEKGLSAWARQSAGRQRINAMVELARDLVLIDHDALDADPWLLGTQNGYVDLRDGSYHQPDPAKLLTMSVGVAYDAAAEAPLWEKCLVDWFPEVEDRDYLQRVLGSTLVGEVRDNVLVIAWGSGANGKTTCLGTVGSILGDYFTVPHKSLVVESRYEQHPTAVADLFRKRLAVAAETDRRIALSETSVKNLTGGDILTARRMREDFWRFKPSHTMVLQTNHLPMVTPDPAIWRRLRVVPFVAHFEGDVEDRELPHRLAEEGPGILNWLIEGVARWQAVGVESLPRSVQQATARYRASEDLVSRWLDECGWEIVDPRLGFTTARDLTQSWAEWIEELTGDKGARFNEVSAELSDRGCERKLYRYRDERGKRHQETRWHGVIGRVA